jgi:hypothetical protein
MFFPVIFFPIVYFYLFLIYWSACSKGFILFWVFLVSSSICKSPSSIFYSAGLVVANSFSFSLLWNILISPSMRKDSFSGQTSQGWQLMSFKSWIMSFHGLLAFRVWVEQTAVIPMCLLLYVTCLFSFTAFKVLSLLCVLSGIVYDGLGVFPFWSWQFCVLSAFCTWVTPSFLRSGKFSAIILLNRLSIILACIVFSSFYTHDS